MTTSSSVTRFLPTPDICSVRDFSNDWDLNHRNVSSHRSGGCKAKIRRLAGWGAGRPLPALRTLPSRGVLTGWREISTPSGKTSSHHIRAPLTTPVNLNYLLNDFAMGLRGFTSGI